MPLYVSIHFQCIDSCVGAIYRIVTMTNWLPDLTAGTGPIYIRLADRIERDIASGTLAGGAKLPPQRDLAYDIGVTIGTVGRAYALVRERGLVSGEVGRGTFVIDRAVEQDNSSQTEPTDVAGTRPDGAAPGKLVMDSTSAPDVGQGGAIAGLLGDIVRDHPDKAIDYTRTFPLHWREAGARWMAAGGWKPDPQNIVSTVGVHASAMAVITAMTAPGDKVVFEQLTYASISRSANLLGRRSLVLRTDEHGPDPDDFDRLCAQQHPKLLFVIPSLHNPTLVTMPVARRRAIAELARKHNVWIIEDSIYGVLLDEQPAPISAFAPERTFHISGLSKAVAAGVRGGWVACPPNLAARVQVAHKMVTGGLPFLLAELSAQLVMSGEADAIRQRTRDEIAAREAIARESFSGLDFASDRRAPFLWMKLPDPWLSGTFRQASASEGVLIDDEDDYKPGRTEQVYHRIRIGFSNPRSRDEVKRGFTTIRRLLDNPNAGYDSYG